MKFSAPKTAVTVVTAAAALLTIPAMASAATAHAAAKHPSRVSVSASPRVSAAGTVVKLSATVSSANPKPTGLVSFWWGHTRLCAARVVNRSAHCDTEFRGAGSYGVRAIYWGDAQHRGATGYVRAVATKAGTSTNIAVSTTTPAPGQRVTFTAAVSSRSRLAVAGWVHFTVGNTTLCSGSVHNGRAVCGYAWKSAGSFRVTARYLGDRAHGGSARTSGTITVKAPAPATYATTTVFSNLKEGPAVNHTALGVWNWTVQVKVTNNTPGGPAPTGTVSVTAPVNITDQNPLVTFFGCGAGATAAPGKPVTAAIQLTPVPGTNYSQGSCNVSTPTNSYGFVLQQANYTPSSSEFVKSGTGNEEWKMINYMPTTTTVTSTAAAAGAVTLSANVAPQAPIPADNILDDFSEIGTPTVAFTLSQTGVQIAACAAAPLQAPDATHADNFATCDAGTLAAGTYTVTATYSGDEYSYTSTDTETLTVG